MNSDTEEEDYTKEDANKFFKEGKYNEAITIYTHLLESNEDDISLLSNRSAAYIKTHGFNLALKDCIRVTKLKPDWGKAWGRLGASLYGLEKYNDAMTSYIKANELEPNEIYTNMMEHIQNKLNDTVPTNFMNMFDSLLLDQNIINKLNNKEFQDKVLSLQSNPLAALKDNDIMDVVKEMVSKLKVD
jgi:small glutamine-rich tetratricopeptide repeat-containing protein alpha